jgi:hypothetical protein
METSDNPVDMAETHHGREHLFGGLALVLEILALVFGIYPLAVGAAFFFLLAILGYSKKRRTGKSKKWSIVFGSLVAIMLLCVMVGGSYALMRLRERKGHSIPAASGAPSPQVPIVKTPPSRKEKPSVKIEQRGKGSGAVGGDISTGPCSNVLVGGNNNQATVNCGSPPLPEAHIAGWRQDTTAPYKDEDNLHAEHPAVIVSFWLDHNMALPGFLATCDRPCETWMATCPPTFVAKRLTSSDPKVVGVVFQMPRPFPALHTAFWYVRSRDDKPINIINIRPLQEQEIPEPFK